MKLHFSLFTFLLFTLAAPLLAQAPKSNVTVNASNALINPSAANFISANGIVPNTRMVAGQLLNADVTVHFSDLAGVIADTQLSGTFNINHIPGGLNTLVVDSTSYPQLLYIGDGLVQLGDPIHAHNGTSLTVDDVTTQSIIATGTAFTFNGGNVLTEASDIDISQINGTTGSALLMSNGSGGITNVTLGTGLSFSGTTLNGATTTPAGSGTELQYRNGSAFGAVAGSSYDGTTVTLSLAASGPQLLLSGPHGNINFQDYGTMAFGGSNAGFYWQDTGHLTTYASLVNDGSGNIVLTVNSNNLFTGLSTGILQINGLLHMTPRAAPGSPTEGDCYQSSADHHFYIYNGSAWKQLDN